MTDWKPRVGEFSVTRDGRKAMVSFDDETEDYPLVGVIADEARTTSWTRAGRYRTTCADRRDLIGPWVEPGETLPAPTRAEFDALKAEVEAMKKGAHIAGHVERCHARAAAAWINLAFAGEFTREGQEYWDGVCKRLRQIAEDGIL